MNIEQVNENSAETIVSSEVELKVLNKKTLVNREKITKWLTLISDKLALCYLVNYK